jgi:chromosomal replication initiator protein
MWFDRTARMEYDPTLHRLDVAVPNRFVAEWIGKNFEGQLRDAARHEIGELAEVHLDVRPESFSELSPPVAEPLAATAESREEEALLRPAARHGHRRATHGSEAAPLRHRLEDFIIGPSNELAFAAAQRLVDEEGAANPLFLHGGCGLGKTHLLQGICRRVLERNPKAQVLYTTGEQFTNEFLAAMRANRVDAFRRKVRRLDLLAVDDVHFIANKQATQQEFLHSFDAIELGGARVVLASDSHPKLIRQFSEALVSRCVRGMVVEVKQPDTATRARIVRALAQRRGICLMETVIDVIAARCAGSVREIEGTLAKLHALATLTHKRPADGEGAAATAFPGAGAIGHTLVNHLFDSEFSHSPRKVVRFEAIIGVVSEQLGVGRLQITGNGRNQHVVLARSIVIHLARQMTPMSYPEIAAAMGKKNHSTVITAAQRVDKQLAAGAVVTLPASMETLALSDLVQRMRQIVLRA